MNTLKKAHIILLVIALNFFFVFSSHANQKSLDHCLIVFQRNGSSKTFNRMAQVQKEDRRIIVNKNVQEVKNLEEAKEALIRVAEEGDIEAVGSSLPEVSDKAKTVALHKAVENRHQEAVKLIGQEVNVNIRYNGKPPLITAIKMVDKKMTELLIDLGADANAASYENGETALMVAIEMGDIGIVKLLVNKGADVNKPDFSKDMPLDKARQRGDEEIVGLLESTIRNKSLIEDYIKDQNHTSSDNKIVDISKYLQPLLLKE